jgi:hypothetical protein
MLVKSLVPPTSNEPAAFHGSLALSRARDALWQNAQRRGELPHGSSFPIPTW